MSQLNYVEIRIPAGEHRGLFGRPAYEQVIQVLWDLGAPGMTLFRGEEGLDAKGRVQNIHSEYLQDSLPIILDMVVTMDELPPCLEAVQNPLRGLAHCVTVTPALDVKSLPAFFVELMNMEETSILKIYLQEEDRYHKVPLYHALVLAAKKKHLLWVNVQRALAGFGSEHVLRRNKLFDVAEHAPVVVEITGTIADIQDFVRENESMIRASSGPAILITGKLVSGSI